MLSTINKQYAQRGVALITALLIVALATITAVAMTSQQQLDIRRTANVIQGTQAYLYALGGESWAKRILIRDAQTSNNDSLQEKWATTLPPLPIPGGYLQGHLEDLQGRFNLNNLVTADGQVNAHDVKRFERLLTALQLPMALTQIVIDWIDVNQTVTLPNGAEDNTYLMQQPPYRTADTKLYSPTELRLLAEMDEIYYQQLLPYITTLPIQTTINLNTAPPLIFKVLVEGLSDSAVNQIITARDKQPFESVEAFLKQEAIKGLTVDTNNLSVSSHYFLYTATVQIDRGYARLSSLLYRANGTVRVLLRSQE